MKTIRCNLTKTCQIFTTLTESYDKYIGILPEKFQEFSFIHEELYALLYHWYMLKALSLLVY